MTVLALLDPMSQNSLQPSIPFNQNRQVLAALINPVIQNIGLTAPPATTEGANLGQIWIPDATATGAWAGQENTLAICVGTNLWAFIDPPVDTRVRVLLDNATPINNYYRWNGTTFVDDSADGMVPEAPNDGTYNARRNEAWTAFVPGVNVDDEVAVDGQAVQLLISGGLVLEAVSAGVLRISAPPRFPPVVTDATSARAATLANAGEYTRFTHAAPTYTFDTTSIAFPAGYEYHGRYAGSGTLTIAGAGGMTITPPAEGTLLIPPNGTFTVKITSDTTADLIGTTVPA